ncbi:MAG: hypothetical protein IKG51_02825 [Firmicutes bacterium]|nr:hypothetical protein [Bacillota bacterium]
MMKIYIASCVFTSQFPELSLRIQNYVREHFDLKIVRCCVPRYKIQEFEEKMPEGQYRMIWQELPDSEAFSAGDEVYSLCHNCNNIIEEMHPGTQVHSLWELLDSDRDFPFPDYHGIKVTVQDCWRSRERLDEQEAVRSLLGKMNIQYVEAPDHHEAADFCGASLYRPQPPRNPKLAPKHYVEGAVGKFVSHTEEEQKRIMQDYCRSLPTEKVVCYCHYCLEGLRMGGSDAAHIVQLMFPEQSLT